MSRRKKKQEQVRQALFDRRIWRRYFPHLKNQARRECGWRVWGVDPSPCGDFTSWALFGNMQMFGPTQTAFRSITALVYERGDPPVVHFFGQDAAGQPAEEAIELL